MKTPLLTLSLIVLFQPIYSSAKEDKAISLSEIQSREAKRFEKLDSNGDGHISIEEFEKSEPNVTGKQHNMRRKGGHRNQRWATRKPPFAHGEKHNREASRKKAHSKEMFIILDKDHNKSLSELEFLGASDPENHRLAQQRTAFRFFDRNEDGKLSRNELPSRAKRLATLDNNQDGIITDEEMTNRSLRRQ